MVKDTVGSINYMYSEEAQITEYTFDKYIFLTKYSFVLVNSSSETLSFEEYPDFLVDYFFDEFESSYDPENWVNIKRVSEAEVKEFDGFRGWICSFTLDHKETLRPCRADVFLHI